jgi:hypothetical protein
LDFKSIFGLVIAVIIGSALIGIAANSLVAGMNPSTQDQFTKRHVPINFTLVTNDRDILTSVTNCTTATYAASNYTDKASEGYITMLDNKTKGVSVCVNYKYGEQMPAGFVWVGGLLLLLVVVAFLMYFFDGSGIGSGSRKR